MFRGKRSKNVILLCIMYYVLYVFMVIYYKFNYNVLLVLLIYFIREGCFKIIGFISFVRKRYEFMII